MATPDCKKILYASRKENGLCVKCGKPNDNGKVLCDYCTIYNRKYNKIKKSNNQCLQCGEPISNHATYCKTCRKKNQTEYRKSLYNNRKENGLCTRCGKPNNNQPKLTCTICEEYQRELKATYNKSGVCDLCGREYAVIGLKKCAYCLEKYRKRNSENYYTYYENNRIKINARYKARYDKRKANKICVRCGKKAYLWYTKCAVCLERDRQINRRYEERKVLLN